MFTPLLLATIIAPDLFGTYSLMKMVLFLFASIFVYSSLGPFVVFSNQEHIESGKMNKSFSAQLVIILATTVLFFVITLVFNNVITSFVNVTNSELLFLFLAYIGIVLRYFTNRLFLAQNNRSKDSQYSLAYGLISILVILGIYVSGRMNIQTLLLAYFISGVLSLAVFIRFINFSILFPFVLDKAHFRSMFDYTKWQVFGAASLYLINWGDNLVLKYYVSIAEIGVYNLAYQIFKGLMGFLLIINSYFLPTISQKIDDLKALTKYFFSVRPKIVTIGLMLVAAFFVVFPPVFKVVYSNSYSEAVTVIKILSIGIALELYNIFYATLLTASKSYKFTQITNIVHVSLNILLNLVFVPMYGIMGAAIGTVSAYLIRNVIYEIFIFAKYKKLSLFSRVLNSTN